MTPYDYTRARVVVTGASSGIGAATAARLASLGARVVLGARGEAKLAKVAARIERAGGRCVAVPCDVSRPEGNERLVRAAVDAFGGIDVLVMNAGRGHAQSIEDTRTDTLEELFRLNVFALYYGVQAALPWMRRQGSGHFVTVASMAGKVAMPYASAYVACKHAAVGFTHALRLELAETGIHATVVCPANVATPWAASTEGVSMLDLATRAMPEAARIARERGIDLVDTTVLSPRAVADAIAGAIEHPVAEVFTHPGSHDVVVRAAEYPAQSERAALPLALAMRRAYADLSAAPKTASETDSSFQGAGPS
jgi:short-subunit dehydrogenase